MEICPYIRLKQWRQACKNNRVSIIFGQFGLTVSLYRVVDEDLPTRRVEACRDDVDDGMDIPNGEIDYHDCFAYLSKTATDIEVVETAISLWHKLYGD